MCIRDRLTQVLLECGVPAGVLNVVSTAHTGEVMEPIIRDPVSYTHLRAHETVLDIVCRLLLEKKTNIHTMQLHTKLPTTLHIHIP